MNKTESQTFELDVDFVFNVFRFKLKFTLFFSFLLYYYGHCLQDSHVVGVDVSG